MNSRFFKAIAALAIFVIVLISAWAIHPVLSVFIALLGYPAIDGVLSQPREP